MRNVVIRLATFAVLLGVASSVTRAGQADSQVFQAGASAAGYLFERAHLSAITKPSTLRYRFERRAAAGDSFTDVIDLKVDAIKEGGRRDTSFAFFTGARVRPYPAMPDFLGNPLIAVFLQRDVWALSRLRGGQARYFRYRIRQAFRDAAVIEEKTIKTERGDIQAHSIVITPYKDDRYRKKLDQFEFKTYEFVVSTQVPGEIYMIRTRVPSADKTDLLIEETVTFDGVHDNPGGASQ